MKPFFRRNTLCIARKKWCTAGGKDPLLGRVDGFQIDPSIGRDFIRTHYFFKIAKKHIHTLLIFYDYATIKHSIQIGYKEGGLL